MQSHDDWSANDALEVLRQKAERLTERGDNLITAGAPNERALIEKMRGGFLLRQLPDDPLALRISIGEVRSAVLTREYGGRDSSYLVFRGDRDEIVSLLRRALAALDA